VALYVDTSALLKLVVSEPETPALHEYLEGSVSTLVSSDLARTEVIRAVRRGASEQVVRARAVLDALTLLSLTTETFEAAGRLDPSILRSLDALHLAAALSLGDDLEAVITYDARFAEACRANGVTALAPR
jgi:predicted nucleic acid-binding protein